MPLGDGDTNPFDRRFCEEDYAEKIIDFINYIINDTVPELLRTRINWIYSNRSIFYVTNRNHLLKRYEDTYYHEKILEAGKAVYIEQNYYMIDKSKFCIAYCDESYASPRRRNSKGDLLDYQPKKRNKACV